MGCCQSEPNHIISSIQFKESQNKLSIPINKESTSFLNTNTFGTIVNSTFSSNPKIISNYCSSESNNNHSNFSKTNFSNKKNSPILKKLATKRLKKIQCD